MRSNILTQYGDLPDVKVFYDGRGMQMPLPSDKGNDGHLTVLFPADCVALDLIDIQSETIPDRVADPLPSVRELKINYCAKGRCELKLENGEVTYLTGGEISVDAGQALNSFYYPGGEYEGFEVVVFMDGKCGEVLSLLRQPFDSPQKLFDSCSRYQRPWIRNADSFLQGIYENFLLFMKNGLCMELFLLKISELLYYLEQFSFDQSDLRRTYYTPSQIEIAKRTHEIIVSDWSVRYTAKQLAERFGVSESSLKNYFSSVYGCGYAEYQHAARMRRAAKLLSDTESKVAEIAAAVGFSTQAKFGAAFKECYGVTPLEYRRTQRLK